MINIFLGICGTLFLAALTLVIVGICKQITLMEKITRPFLLPIILAVSILILQAYLPDSKNVIRWVSIATVLGIISTSLDIFGTMKFKNVLISGFYALSNLAWFALLLPSFHLFPLPPAILSSACVLYGGLIIFLYFSQFKKLNTGNSIIMLIYSATACALHLSSVLTILATPRVFSGLILAGTTLLCYGTFLEAKKICQNENRSELLLTLVYLLAELFITAGCVLMPVL